MLTVPTWIAAIATVGLFIGAIVTAVFAALAFGKQAEEVRMQREEFARADSDRRRAQAAQVFTWVGERPVREAEDPRPAACVRNTSTRPIYDISISWGNSPADSWRVLMPGEENAVRGAGSAVADGACPILVEFRDAAGIRWRATSDGKLVEMSIISGRTHVTT